MRSLALEHTGRNYHPADPAMYRRPADPGGPSMLLEDFFFHFIARFM